MRCAQPDATDCDDSFDEDFYNYSFAMFPLLNQDGYYYTWSNDRLWRKNRTPSEDGPCIGTDLNRNADVAWGATGSSDNTCSQVGSKSFVCKLTRFRPTLELDLSPSQLYNTGKTGLNTSTRLATEIFVPMFRRTPTLKRSSHRMRFRKPSFPTTHFQLIK